jgi:hypothetical protein
MMPRSSGQAVDGGNFAIRDWRGKERNTVRVGMRVLGGETGWKTQGSGLGSEISRFLGKKWKDFGGGGFSDTLWALRVSSFVFLGDVG